MFADTKLSKYMQKNKIFGKIESQVIAIFRFYNILLGCPESADVEGKLKRRKFKFQYTFIKLYRLIGTNFLDNLIISFLHLLYIYLIYT